jgi:hypothetical protein
VTGGERVEGGQGRALDGHEERLEALAGLGAIAVAGSADRHGLMAEGGVRRHLLALERLSESPALSTRCPPSAPTDRRGTRNLPDRPVSHTGRRPRDRLIR